MPFLRRIELLERGRKKAIPLSKNEKGVEKWKASRKSSSEIGIGVLSVVHQLKAISFFAENAKERRLALPVFAKLLKPTTT